MAKLKMVKTAGVPTLPLSRVVLTVPADWLNSTPVAVVPVPRRKWLVIVSEPPVVMSTLVFVDVKRPAEKLPLTVMLAVSANVILVLVAIPLARLNPVNVQLLPPRKDAVVL